MFRLRFGETIPARRSVEQLRGIEGARVRALYAAHAKACRVDWKGRNYDTSNWAAADTANRALSAGNACMHGLCEAVLTACGYHPGVGFVHTGNVRSFVYDIADLYKAEYSIPLAFQLAHRSDVETAVRHQLRDMFRQKRLVDRIVSDTDSLFEEA